MEKYAVKSSCAATCVQNSAIRRVHASMIIKMDVGRYATKEGIIVSIIAESYVTQVQSVLKFLVSCLFRSLVCVGLER